MDTSNSGGSQSATAKDTSASSTPSLSERLRERIARFQSAHGNYLYYSSSDASLDLNAARAIEYAAALTPQLRDVIVAKDARIAELEATLWPFSALAKRMLDKDIPRHIQDDESTPVLSSGLAYEDPDAVAVTVGDLRRAAKGSAAK